MDTDLMIYNTYIALKEKYSLSYAKQCMVTLIGESWKKKMERGRYKASKMKKSDTGFLPEEFSCVCGKIIGVSQYGKLCPDCKTRVTLKN